jgi:hypothetical protein
MARHDRVLVKRIADAVDDREKITERLIGAESKVEQTL